MSCDNCYETIGNPDPFRIIYNWCTNVPVPRWVGERAYKNCYHCGDNFKSGHQHHCRLCGEMFCSRCTGKFNIPNKYELKGKEGPTRVCYQCKNSCVRRRQEAEGTRPFRLTSSFTAPVWQEPSTYVSCEKCRKREKNPHNCRLCGYLYCDNCTLKMDIVIPLEFNKKNKPGPHRTCDECRYRYKAGALIKGPHDPPSPESRYLSAEAIRNSNSKSDLSDRLSRLSISGGPPKFSLNDEEPLSDGEIPAPPPRTTPVAATTSTETVADGDRLKDNETIIVVKRVGKSTPVAVLHVPIDGTLDDVYNSLLLKCPDIRSKNIQLIVRGEPVSKSHWDIFKTRHCRGEVLISEIGVGPTRVMAPLPTTRPHATSGQGTILPSNVSVDLASKHSGNTSRENASQGDDENAPTIDNKSTSAFAQAVFNSRG